MNKIVTDDMITRMNEFINIKKHIYNDDILHNNTIRTKILTEFCSLNTCTRVVGMKCYMSIRDKLDSQL